MRLANVRNGCRHPQACQGWVISVPRGRAGRHGFGGWRAGAAGRGGRCGGRAYLLQRSGGAGVLRIALHGSGVGLCGQAPVHIAEIAVGDGVVGERVQRVRERIAPRRASGRRAWRRAGRGCCSGSGSSGKSWAISEKALMASSSRPARGQGPRALEARLRVARVRGQHAVIGLHGSRRSAGPGRPSPPEPCRDPPSVGRWPGAGGGVRRHRATLRERRGGEQGAGHGQ